MVPRLVLTGALLWMCLTLAQSRLVFSGQHTGQGPDTPSVDAAVVDTNDPRAQQKTDDAQYKNLREVMNDIDHTKAKPKYVKFKIGSYNLERPADPFTWAKFVADEKDLRAIEKLLRAVDELKARKAREKQTILLEGAAPRKGRFG